jgi:hypothetical protein
MANGRQHDAASVYTGEYQRVDAVGAQQRLEAGPMKGLMRCLTTIGSPSRAAAAGWIAAPSLQGSRASVLFAGSSSSYLWFC